MYRLNYVVAVPVNENVASFIGKKGSENGLIFYNRKIDDKVIVALMPVNSEDKLFYGMAESMLIAGQIVISTASVDKMLGESIVAASLLDKHVIIIDETDVSGMVNGLFKDFEYCGMDSLLDRITSNKEQHDGSLRIDIDKAFPVKGIGTVALGIVTRGIVRVHDQLHHWSGKTALVKSIQSQDVDVSEAGYGTRVGLALKGIEYGELDKGDLMLATPYKKSREIEARLNVSPLSNEKLETNKRYVFISNFSRVECHIEEIAGNAKNESRIVFEKPLSIIDGDAFMLIREKAPRIFASGTVTKCL